MMEGFHEADWLGLFLTQALRDLHLHEPGWRLHLHHHATHHSLRNLDHHDFLRGLRHLRLSHRDRLAHHGARLDVVTEVR